MREIVVIVGRKYRNVSVEGSVDQFTNSEEIVQVESCHERLMVNNNPTAVVGRCVVSLPMLAGINRWTSASIVKRERDWRWLALRLELRIYPVSAVMMVV